MKESYLQNIQFSSEIIVFDQQNHQGELIIFNKHTSLGVIFKIKATKLNIIQVKPAKGFIKPQSKVTINFKLGVVMEKPNMEELQANDKFLIQFLNIPNRDATREEVEVYWKAYKNGTANLQHGYGCYRVFMNLTGKNVVFNSGIRSSKQSKTMKSSVRSQIKSIQSPDDLTTSNKSSGFKNQHNDEDLSKKYTQLKEKQEILKEKRESIFKPKSKSTKAKGNIKSYLIFLIVFLLAFASGNYLRSTMIKIKQQQQVVQQQKPSFFASFFN